MTYFRIEAPHFVAAVRFDDNGIADYAAPILHWLVKRRTSVSWVQNYCRRAGWKMELLA